VPQEIQDDDKAREALFVLLGIPTRKVCKKYW
jgi:hypothetical protein